MATLVHQKHKQSIQVSPVFRLGWRQPPSPEEIVDQSKNLCGRYIRTRLRHCCETAAGKKLSLQRLRSATNIMAGGCDLSAVATQLRRLCGELETAHPKLFTSVVANVGLSPTPPSELTLHNLFTAVADNLVGSAAVDGPIEPNWGRVVALYTLSGALAVDCVKLGRADLVLSLVDMLGNFVERELVEWITEQGGWEALLDNFRKSRRLQVQKVVIYLAFPALVGVASYIYCSI